MPKFRKKPVEIEAFQFQPRFWRDWGPIAADDPKHVPAWFTTAEHEGKLKIWSDDEDPYCMIETLEGRMKAERGDFIIRGIKGEIYPCKPDIFAATYDEVIERAVPTIAELERILQEPDRKVRINPDGTVIAEVVV